MEIEKVIRILAIFIAAAAFALCVAKRLMFPDAPHTADLPIAIAIGLALVSVWRGTCEKEENQNK